MRRADQDSGASGTDRDALETAGDRDIEGRDRDLAAEERDVADELRDREAEGRDDAAGDLDRAAGDRAATDRQSAADEGARAASGRAKAADNRAKAINDRKVAAEDRAQAVNDREVAAGDRVQAAKDREDSGTDALTGARRREAGLAAQERDVAAELRDRDAEARDAAAGDLDRAAGDRAATDRQHAADEGARAASGRAEAAGNRAKAINDREFAAEDRAQGSHDREVAAEDRAQGSHDREVAAEDRAQGSHDREVAAEDRAQGSHALEYQALHDSLTGLPNRTLLVDRLDRELLAATRNKCLCGLLIMDVDQFKDVNDALGHEAGDRLLEDFAKRIKETLRDQDTLARLGDNEFAILPVGAGEMGAIMAIATKVLAALEKPFVIEGITIHAGASIGIAVFPDHAPDPTTLMRRADVAMYVAKHSHSGYAVYAAQQEETLGQRMTLLGELREAIANNELALHYQPRVNVRSKRTVGVEALVRWSHPRYGLLPPAEFIPAAEESDLIRPLTRWVLNEALGQLHAWELAGIVLGASVNLSAANLLDSELPTMVADLLRTWSIPAGRLILEITETTVISTDVDETLKRLRTLGVGLSTDDFGTGYASLTYLRRLPLSELKLDRSFVGSMATNPDDAAIVKPAISLGHNLGLTVVAEGVEDEATWDMLAAFECDLAQGYYMARPMPPGQLAEWLARDVWGLAETRASAIRSRGRR